MKSLVTVLSLVFLTLPVSAASSNTKNFRFSPLAVLIGALNLNLDFTVNENWTVGPEALYWRFTSTSSGGLLSDIDINAYSFGVRGNWYNNGVFTDGLYVGPSVNYTSATASSNDIQGKISAKASGIFLRGIVGYGWFWDSFNMLLGGGLTVSLSDTTVEIRDSSGTYTEANIHRGGAALEWTIGWTF
ncbi:MAG: hypothetical protein SGJ18_09095 [Pseudomonadota bacterium]|nr:hypothetical protein [Pseudomonadota bacterium]